MLQLPEGTPVIGGRQPIIGGVYRHFTGNLYRVIAVSKHTETGEFLVIYQSEGDNSKVCARPIEMFMSKVDKEKYPDADQDNRFEYCQETNNFSIGGEYPYQRELHGKSTEELLKQFSRQQLSDMWEAVHKKAHDKRKPTSQLAADLAMYWRKVDRARTLAGIN